MVSRHAVWKTDCRSGAQPDSHWKRAKIGSWFMMVASLPMYDLPEIEQATNTWWRGLAKAFRREGIADVPDNLWRCASFREVWTRDDLLLSQTCGYPLMHELRGKVTLV